MDTAKILVDRLYEFVDLLPKCAKRLDKLADELEEIQKNVSAAKVVGSSVAVGGAAALTLAGVATLFTGGAALPIIAIAGGAASWIGTATNVTSDIVGALKSTETLNEARVVAERIEDLHQDILALVEKLKEEAKKKGEQADGYVAEYILRDMARRNKLMVDNSVSLRKTLKGLCPNAPIRVIVKLCVLVQAVAALTQAVMRLLARLGGTAAREVASEVGRNAAKAAGRIAGGALGLVISVPDLVDNWNNLDNPGTEASRCLRKNADGIRDEHKKMKEDLQDLNNLFGDLAKVKRCLGNAQRHRFSKKASIEYTMKQCENESMKQWLKDSESENIFKLMAMLTFL